MRILDKFKERFREPIDDVEYHYGDFGNRGVLDDAMIGIEVVFHLISSTIPQTSNQDPTFDVISNIGETLYLLDRCVERGISKIVFISSGGTVYGNPLSLPVPENAQTAPICSYGITKLTIEQYLYLYHHLYGLEYTVVRPANPYGARQNPESIQGAVTVFLASLCKNQEIEIWGDGEVVRDFLFIDDLVDALYKSSMIATPSRVFNVGSGSGISLNNMIQLMEKVTGYSAKVCYHQARSLDVQKIWLDINRAEKELLWSPQTPLAEGIMKTWSFLKDHVR